MLAGNFQGVFFSCLDFLNGFNLYILPAAGLQTADDVIERRVIGPHTLDDNGGRAAMSVKIDAHVRE